MGSIRSHLGDNVPTLAAAGYRCTFVVPQDSIASLSEVLGEGCDFVSVPSHGPGASLWRTVRGQLHDRAFALVHAHGLTAAVHASLGRLGMGVPLVATLHEPLRDAQRGGMTGQAKRWLLGRILARAEAIVTGSDDSRARLLRCFPNLRRNAARLHAIANGINITRREVFRAGDLRHELDLDDDTTLIGYVGPLLAEKGIELLIEAAARLVRYGSVAPFHVAAFGADSDAYRDAIEQKGLAGHFSLHDGVDGLAAVADHLDLLVVPAPSETSSRVALEALAAGVPVLGTDAPGLREVLADTPARLVRAGEAAALEIGLREALACPWTDRARAFAATARRRFDHRPSARLLVDLYDRLALAS
jgi:glycosyltransferase involved in cell wall biosynthesis